MAAVAAVVVAIIGIGVSIDQQKAQQSEQRKQRRLVESQNANRREQERRRLIRQRRAAKARIEQAAVNTGVGGSSGELAGVGALATDFAINNAFLSGQQSLGQELQASQGRQATAATRQQFGSLLTQVGTFGIQNQNLFADTGTAVNTTPVGPVQ